MIADAPENAVITESAEALSRVGKLPLSRWAMEKFCNRPLSRALHLAQTHRLATLGLALVILVYVGTVCWVFGVIPNGRPIPIVVDPKYLHTDASPAQWLDTVFSPEAPDSWSLWMHKDTVSGRRMVFSQSAKVVLQQEPYVKHIFDQVQCINASGGRRGFFVDGGGNVGLYSLLARARGCDVLTVEMQPACSEMMRMAERANHIEPPTPIVARPLYEKDEVAFRVAERSSPAGGCEGIFSLFWHGSLPLMTVTLDTLLRDEPRHIDLLKLDLEGFEPKAIAGAMRLFTQHQVTAALVEATWWPNVFSPLSKAYHMMAYVLNHGYSIRCLSPEEDFAYRSHELWITYGESTNTMKHAFPEDPSSVYISVCAEYLVCLEPCPYTMPKRPWQ
jgi:FkbM family methyltransferase